jgi:hypothetical protein
MNEGKVRTAVRPVIVIFLTFTLCVGAIAQAAGWAELPAWFMAMAIPAVAEWIGERAVMRAREKKD